MAASRKSPPSDDADGLVAGVEARLDAHLDSGARITLALSGGLDSVVLLHCLARLAGRRDFRLEALHVDHGLSPRAGEWAFFCRNLCDTLGIRLTVVEVAVNRGRGESLEAAARRARYRAFRQHARGILVLAHHLDDQAETLLLQLLRGAGPRGAGAIPPRRETGADAGTGPPLTIVRPLLGVPRSQLEAHARAGGLAWVEDESNADTALDRNFLRACVMPLIEERFPGYRKAFARSAGLFQEASALLDELAVTDARGAVRDHALEVAALRNLSEPRARNLLRWFLRQGGAGMPPARRLNEAVRQLLQTRRDAHVCVMLGDAELRCEQGSVRLRPLLPPPDESVAWRGEAVLIAPGGLGEVLFEHGEGAGIALHRLRGRHVELRRRGGGERMRPDCRRPRRTLKNLMQEHRIEPWRRARMPLLFCDEHLVWVPGIGIDCAWQAGPGEPSIAPVWRLAAMQAGIAVSGSLQSRD